MSGGGSKEKEKNEGMGEKRIRRYGEMQKVEEKQEQRENKDIKEERNRSDHVIS